MKSTSLRSRVSRSSGFTLVELLVVIGIIAILAGALFPAISSAMNAAKRTKSANTANQLQTAMLGFYTEYSVYLVPATTTTDTLVSDSDSTNWPNMLISLCGNINPLTATTVASPTITTNTRSIPFLTLKKTDVDSKGGPVNSLPGDAKSQYFNMVIDSDYSGIMGDSGTSTKPVDFTAVAAGGTLTYPIPSGNTAQVSGGIAVWANCDPKTTTTTRPALWVKTF